MAQHAIYPDRREQQGDDGKAGGKFSRIVQPPRGIAHEIADAMEAHDVRVGVQFHYHPAQRRYDCNGSPRVRRTT
jgi:hypothetical protein